MIRLTEYHVGLKFSRAVCRKPFYLSHWFPIGCGGGGGWDAPKGTGIDLVLAKYCQYVRN